MASGDLLAGGPACPSEMSPPSARQLGRGGQASPWPAEALVLLG